MLVCAGVLQAGAEIHMNNFGGGKFVVFVMMKEVKNNRVPGNVLFRTYDISPPVGGGAFWCTRVSQRNRNSVLLSLWG